ncbi:hypothetical protein J2Z30_003195 [Streptomyces iranensis]|uniref:Uncharacterized protein n=1 Tax=Streptomyces iranensis TaxID=576784 RepID=A0ABS4MSC9_9ACTN|nr:hypothetical protein [Streptomyces iranensis]
MPSIVLRRRRGRSHASAQPRAPSGRRSNRGRLRRSAEASRGGPAGLPGVAALSVRHRPRRGGLVTPRRSRAAWADGSRGRRGGGRGARQDVPAGGRRDRHHDPGRDHFRADARRGSRDGPGGRPGGSCRGRHGSHAGQHAVRSHSGERSRGSGRHEGAGPWGSERRSGERPGCSGRYAAGPWASWCRSGERPGGSWGRAAGSWGSGRHDDSGPWGSPPRPRGRSRGSGRRDGAGPGCSQRRPGGRPGGSGRYHGGRPRGSRRRVARPWA